MTKRLATNAVPRLDVFMLHRSGALTSGAVTKWQWPLPTMTITITARCEGHRLFLSINNGEEIAYSIIRRPGTTGSSYPFLGCTCERSARYLYIHNNHFACRHCHNLGYPSRTPQRRNTTLRRISRLHAQLAMLEAKALETFRRPNDSLARLKSILRATP
jgi:hypothetical protein